MKKRDYCFLVIGIVLWAFIALGPNNNSTEGTSGNVQAVELSVEEQKYSNWLKAQITGDGSNIVLTKYVKDNLNNPKSFEHVKTIYLNHGKDGKDVKVKMVYRATNSFNAIITKDITANIIYETNKMTILEQ